MTAELFPSLDGPLALEHSLRKAGHLYIAGIDEAGRGALAGPVVAAAVILGESAHLLAGEVRDSKKLSAAQRERLLPMIEAHALSIGVGLADAEEIDRTDILRAALEAMRRAVELLAPLPSLCLVDGNQRAPLACAQLTIVRGDDRVLSISAASIVAKVTRDRMMAGWAERFPAYRFEDNKGYGTESHQQALRDFGPCPIHRLTFAPLNARGLGQFRMGSPPT